jgi:hypothetical protein
MIPLAQYAIVSEASSFYETVLALRVAQRQFGQDHDTPNTILVLNKKGGIAGQIDYWDLLRAMEPRYATMGYPRQIIDSECNDCKFPGSILRTYGLWSEPLQGLCDKSTEVTASKIMRPITATERIEEQACMDEAINGMIMQHLTLMLVTLGDEPVGVLRLADVAKKMLYRTQDCRVPLIDGSDEHWGYLAA